MKTDIAYIYGLIDPTSELIKYIGKTIDTKERLRNHISESKKGNSYKCIWIRSLLKRNLKPVLKVLKICPLSDFIKYESYYISMYKSNKLTNSDYSGQGNIGRSRDIIDRVSAKISKKVYQFDLNGNYIQDFKSARDASRKLGIPHSYISRCCNGIYKHTGGFIYRYENIFVESINTPNAIKKSVAEIDANGNIVNVWKSIADCSRETKIDSGNISKVCNNKMKRIKNRIFKFIDI